MSHYLYQLCEFNSIKFKHNVCKVFVSPQPKYVLVQAVCVRVCVCMFDKKIPACQAQVITASLRNAAK